MKKIGIAGFIALVLAFAWWSLPSVPRPEGERAAGGHSSHAGDPDALTDGVVVSIDRRTANVTISHGPILNLGMSPMTMGFRVAEPALLQNIKPGDRVRFHVDVVGGAFTVTSMQAAP
jgi:Cu(I)/Ag(I) efflux system periplasmic protein CusF